METNVTNRAALEQYNTALKYYTKDISTLEMNSLFDNNREEWRKRIESLKDKHKLGELCRSL